MNTIHGGNIYRNHVNIDFSVNVNPLGIPKAVKSALHEAVEYCDRYPDITSEKLKAVVSGMLEVSEEYLLFGNGASELLMAVVQGIRPEKTVILVPSFYGYEYASGAVDGKIIFYETKEENAFCPEEDFFSVLTEDVDLLFLANPNNPTGNIMSREYVRTLLYHCRNKGIYVVLDECFADFCGEEISVLHEVGKYSNLILIRAFTKIFSIPGVRLGYLVCSNRLLLEKIARQLPEWNISGFAQAAGYECAFQIEFIKRTVDYIKKERRFLEDGFRQFGIKVYPGKGNFIFIYSGQPLYERLLKKEILIRDCENFRGLSKGFYRIAVKTRKENETLLEAMGEIIWTRQRK